MAGIIACMPHDVPCFACTRTFSAHTLTKAVFARLFVCCRLADADSQLATLSAHADTLQQRADSTARARDALRERLLGCMAAMQSMDAMVEVGTVIGGCKINLWLILSWM